MTSRDFCYWLQGLFELEPGKKTLDAKQLALVRAHLALVFEHEIDPSFGKDREKLQKLHDRITELEARPGVVVHHDGGPRRIMC